MLALLVNADELCAAIEAAPDDPAGYAVYGDWLSEQGDPLAEIVSAQHALEAETCSLARHRELTAHLDELTTSYETQHFSPFCARDHWLARWRYGFLERVEVCHHLGAEAMTAIATTPAARFLRELLFHVRPEERRSSWIDPEDTTDPFPALAKLGLPRTLRALDIVIDLWTYDRHQPVDLTSLYPHIQNVEQLTFDEPRSLGIITLPRLIRLLVERFDSGTIDDIARAELPSLHSLTLVDGPWSELARLELSGAPACRELVLQGDVRENDALFAALVRAPLLRQLDTLDLSWITDSRNVLNLAPIAGALMHLQAIKVNATSLSPIVEAGLTHVFGTRLVKV